MKKNFSRLMMLLIMAMVLTASAAQAQAAKMVKQDGKYYFQADNGTISRKEGWRKIGKKKYYITSSGYAATGITKISKTTYGFKADGELRGFTKPFKENGHWYRTDKDGEAEKLSEAQVDCSKDTWKFIDEYTKSSDSKTKKLRKCFDAIYGTSAARYVSRCIELQEFSKKETIYTAVSRTLHRKKKNCYGFACVVASCAKELGYDPYVVVMTRDHAVVMIDGKYYDNMGRGGRFGTSKPYLTSYKIYKKYKF